MLRTPWIPLTLGLVLLAIGPAPTRGQTLLKPATKPAEPGPTELVISPAPLPVPLFKYRLLPLSSELHPGDAAPIYLRIRHEMVEEAWRQIGEKSAAWLALPFDKFPRAEARELVDMWSPRIRQIEFGTRRKTCDWNYTLDEQRLEAIEILLPDAQSMRYWARLLALKARVEIAEGKFDDAIHTIETGIAFGRHVGDGPFLINNLVGIAIVNTILNQAEELISRPGAPNLYWALTALPRPLINTRGGLETEMRMIEQMVPELAGLDQLHAEAEWSIRLDQLRARLAHLVPVSILEQNGKPPTKEVIEARTREIFGPDTAAYVRQTHPHALKYLLSPRGGMSKEQVDRMPLAEAVVRFLAGSYRESRDEYFKTGYLSYPEGQHSPSPDKSEDKTVELINSFLPAVQATHSAVARLESRIAALRVIEAIRLYVSHTAKLPNSLFASSATPIPLNPANNQPFEYRREGSAAILSCATPALVRPPVYRITLHDAAKK